jgi:hypothetical protein
VAWPVMDQTVDVNVRLHLVRYEGVYESRVYSSWGSLSALAG